MLKYRLPGQASIQLNGTFEIVREMVNEGFVVSDFSQQKMAVFRKNNNCDWHFNAQEPYAISEKEYLYTAKKLISTIKKMGLLKVVFSRVMSIPFDESKTEKLYEELMANYPDAFVYCISDPELGTWLGATPELLLRQVKNHGFTVSLAGTKRNNDETPWGEKEILEQRFVSDFIEQTLQECHVLPFEMGKVYTHTAGPVKHLKTDFSFTLNKNQRKELLQRLHPTPAVSGLPRPWSYEVIAMSEKHDRCLYTGYIGLLGQNDANVFVNLRCCQITKGKLHLYLGGGFTKDSVPELEWQETLHKSRTLLNLIEVL
jgi:isochorismate synthase